MLRPIPGAPPDAPNPEFPTGDRVQDVLTEPEHVRSPEHVADPERPMGDNELAERVRDCKHRWQYGGKVALEARIEAAKLLKAKYDADATFRGERYEKFAYMHGCATNKTDAHAMYLLGEFGNAYFARCEAESKLKQNFEWPFWRTAVAKIRREQRTREEGEPGDAGEQESEEEEQEPKPDPIAKLQRERDDLAAQVQAATQQFRNERARREELEDHITALREQLTAKDVEITALRGQLSQLGPDPDPPSRYAVLQDVAKMLHGRIHLARIAGSAEKIEIKAYDDDRHGLFVQGNWPAHAGIQTKLALEIVDRQEAAELRVLLAANYVTLPKGRIVVRELSIDRAGRDFNVTEPEWETTVGPEGKDELMAACKAAKAVDQREGVQIDVANGRLTFERCRFAYSRSDLEWVLRKSWREIKLTKAGIIRVSVGGLLGEFIFYLRGYETSYATPAHEHEQMAQTAERIDRQNLRQTDDHFDNYWVEDSASSRKLGSMAPGQADADAIASRWQIESFGRGGRVTKERRDAAISARIRAFALLEMDGDDIADRFGPKLRQLPLKVWLRDDIDLLTVNQLVAIGDGMAA